MRLTKCTGALLCLIALFAWSCKSKTVTERTESQSSQQTDSVSQLIKETTKALTIPQSTAILSITPDELEKLPTGAVYRAQDGQASATIKRTDTGYEITANCDSLLVLVTNYEREVYHLNSLNTALKTKLKEQKTEIIKEPSGWQWFQIYGFWVLAAFLTIKSIYNRFINKK